MKITMDKHYSLEEVKNALEGHFRNFKIGMSPNKIWIVIPNSSKNLCVKLSGRELSLSRLGDAGDPFLFFFLPIIGWIIMLLRNDISNSVIAKEILEFLSNEFVMGESVSNAVLSNQISKCPSCKNPNEKKLKICEWCGGKML